MKSATILNVMLGKNLGGIEQSFVDYLTAFRTLGYKSIGVTSRRAKIKTAIPTNITIKPITNFGEWDPFASLRLRNLIKEILPDLIITHGRRAAKLIKKAANNIPIAGVTHNYSLNYMLGLDYALATTEDLKSYLTNMGYPEEKIFHVPHMIRFDSSKLNASLSSMQFRKPPIIGVMGRLVKKKGFDIFIKALSILRDEGIKFQVKIAGQGEELKRLQRLTHTLYLEDHIEFLGWVDNKNEFFSSIDIFCLPSTHEPFGIVLLEAFLANKPVVSFRSEGPAEIGTHDENLLFADLGNERDLAAKLKRLITNKKLSFKLAKTGCNLVKEKYSCSIIQTALDDFVKKVTTVKV